ncbi:ABC transporter ATP-binding protein [Marichromatium bheemlicum]|uniref:ABC transporter ATP-binding protein n=1 Tax=Marichromatium bheemlicum TaxID=365339 RepID=UPI0031B61657
MRATALSRHFGRHPALADVELTLDTGQVLGLLGPNGAGKSTCLRLLAGVLAPSSGRVQILGIDLARQPRLAKRQLGYLPERPPLHPELRVNEYLRFCARLRGIPRERLASSVDAAKHRCGLDRVGHQRIDTLSKGYQQRLGIAQAIIHRPRVLILDEPTEGLDPYQIRALRALIRDLAHDCGIILSSHILPEVQAVCDRVMILHRGRVRYDGYPAADHSPHLWRIRLGAPEQGERLRAADCLDQVSALTEDRYRVVLKDGASAADLARELVTVGVDLHELQPERSDLERVFFDLTGAEESA